MAITLEQYKTLRRQGQAPEEAFGGLEPQVDDDQFSLGETVRNIPSSAGRFLGGIAGAVAHPIRTVKALAGVGAGAVEKFIPGRQAEEKYVDALFDVYKERYGGVDNALQTIETDPIGVLADLSIVLTGGGAIAGKIGAVSKVGQTVSKVGQAINPLSAVTKI